MQVRQTVLLVNQVAGSLPPWPKEVMKLFEEERIAVLPADPLVAQYDLEGNPTITLPDDTPIVQAAERLFSRLLPQDGR
jgi:CO dehydrogenase maturation factor